ncbi:MULTISPECIES: aspartyl/asparaginyl beta-hydroxylase domain-containing protein [unclassified Duganella]|uniref:aspartyl/asparaginyl beta-hydroxylase domain-containing protein n=1 Tax=unclassified Duganella TaxID=2636909 RepID=UPI000E354389|nr:MULTISPECIES: aspartyl/asparaginyl beta-hydroxylase domain-containing protein [unclassified Duganella]RFP08929.1 aspartyl beta-hydroxylase [Duganella sp. BJB475]RFP23960.1 aspartyl beta-hydroxylase [Duganella sp. BJB476]
MITSLPHPQTAQAEIAALQAAAIQATQAGKDDEAGRLWERILALQPSHALALTSQGKRALRRGDIAAARRAFERLVQATPADPQSWISLALACQHQKDEAAEDAAIHGALKADPTDLIALILRANLLERQGKNHQSASVYGAVASVAPPMGQLSPDLRAAVTHARQYVDSYRDGYGKFLDNFLEPHYQQMAGENLSRFREALDIMVGRKVRYESQSMMYHYPGLVPTPFFPRAEFPWLDAIEAGTDAIRDEFLNVLHAEQGFTPYLTYADDVPHNQFAELNNSPRWSAFHLLKDGVPVPENAAQCPVTMGLLGGAPQPDQPGRTPTAMFSLLKPKTRIPPHVGVSNARLVTHLPLILPGQCGFRVGNETREWQMGQAWVFDDTIEHEAWNNSEQLRVVLIFDIWHPHLTPVEREMITALTEGINRFRGEAGGFDL